MDSNEREDLDALVRSEGFARFKAYLEREWGTPDHGGGARFTLAARAAANDADDTAALVKMRQVCFAQREIHALMGWVYGSLRDATRAEQLAAAPRVTEFSRRGGL